MSTEENPNGKTNPEGYYVHKETGARVFLSADPGVGTPKIDAFIQAGFVYDGTEEVAAKETLVVDTSTKPKTAVVSKSK